VKIHHLLIFLSFAGLIFLTFLYIWAPSSGMDQKNLILSIFILTCLGGMVAASKPQYCNRKSRDSNGHHPDCGPFQSHTFTLKSKKYCAGCSGLFVGAGLAMGLCLTYYLHPLTSPFLFGVGVAMVFVSLFQLNVLKIDLAGVKFIFNLALVLGSALILLGILEFRPNLSLYFLVLIGLWIYTRTTISATDHDLICSRCPYISCPYVD
jgi:hypothetical protein